ncbi:MAG TPA: hypothetical protein VF183_06100 [Acidimicrobiales bacterium]
MRHTHRTVVLVTAIGLGAVAACGDDTSSPELGAGATTSVDATSTTSLPSTTPPPDLGELTLDESSSVTTAGLDTVIFGMTVAEAERAAGARLVPDETFVGGPSCSVVRPEPGPSGVTFTVANGRIERVDIRPPSTIGTRSGARIGTTVAQLRELFGDQLRASQSQPSAYEFVPRDEADAAFRVVFETDGDTVTAFRAGRVALVASPLPC